MAIVFKHPNPTDAASVDAFETRVGRRLPSAFRSLLIAVSNGGEVESAALKSFAPLGVVAMLGIERGDRLDIEDRLSLGREEDLTEGLIPIADAEGGNLVCLSLRTHDFGAVWFWDHELEGEAAMTLLSDPFEEFIGNLVPYDEISDAGPAPVVTSMWVNPAFRDLK